MIAQNTTTCTYDTHTYVPTHTVTQTWAAVFLLSIYHRSNAAYTEVYQKFIAYSRFIMISTAWALEKLFSCLCLRTVCPIATLHPCRSQEQLKKLFSRYSPDGDHKLIPTLLWCFAYVELTDFLQRMALYWGTRWLFWSERTTDKKKGFFSASVPT